MGLRGKTTSNIKKKGFKNSRSDTVGVKSFKFYHEAAAGETVIDLTNLTIPSG